MLSLLLVALLFGHALAALTLKDVLVVVKHNYPTKLEQVKRHYEFMSQIFPHIRIYGPWKDKEMEALVKHKLPVFLAPEDDELYLYKMDGKTHQMNKSGSVAYRSILAEMKKDASSSSSKYAGYLFVHDDLAMDIKALRTLDLSMPWAAYNSIRSPYQEAINETNWKNLSAGFGWFNQEMGITALDKIYAAHSSVEKRIAKCTGHQHTIYIGKGDFFYIPNNHVAKSFRHIGGIFEANRLFLEFAIPLFMECFAKPAEAVHLKFCSRSGDSTKESLSLVQKECVGSEIVHPLKLSHPSMWEIFEAVSNLK